MAVFTPAEALNMAMQVEKNGQAFYEAAAQKASDPKVRDLMERLAEWEVRHYETFRQLAGEAASLPPLSGSQWEEYDVYLETALHNALFGGPDKALAAVDEIESEEDALRMALGFEKDTLLFYYDLREMVAESQRGPVDQIIREEKSHVSLLAALLRS